MTSMRTSRVERAQDSKRETATQMLRVRLTPREYDNLKSDADGDLSDYVRTAVARYGQVFKLMAVLEQELEQRPLTTFECNLLATVNPEYYLELGGAELTKPPADRWHLK